MSASEECWLRLAAMPRGASPLSEGRRVILDAGDGRSRDLIPTLRALRAARHLVTLKVPSSLLKRAAATKVLVRAGVDAFLLDPRDPHTSTARQVATDAGALVRYRALGPTPPRRITILGDTIPPGQISADTLATSLAACGATLVSPEAHPAAPWWIVLDSRVAPPDSLPHGTRVHLFAHDSRSTERWVSAFGPDRVCLSYPVHAMASDGPTMAPLTAALGGPCVPWSLPDRHPLAEDSHCIGVIGDDAPALAARLDRRAHPCRILSPSTDDLSDLRFLVWDASHTREADRTLAIRATRWGRPIVLSPQRANDLPFRSPHLVTTAGEQPPALVERAARLDAHRGALQGYARVARRFALSLGPYAWSARELQRVQSYLASAPL